MGQGKNTLPDRWERYTATGKPVSGTNFMAFKCPLKEFLLKKVAPTKRFSPDMLREMHPKLSLIIDLTNTNRYYDKQEFLENGVDYAKIHCPGQVIPPPDIVQTFFEVVDKFTSSRPGDGIIGVHCTHGVNRTGYLICKYMIQRLGLDPEEAIANFQEARGHNMERENYIEDLHLTTPNDNSYKPKTKQKIERLYERCYIVNREPQNRPIIENPQGRKRKSRWGNQEEVAPEIETNKSDNDESRNRNSPVRENSRPKYQREINYQSEKRRTSHFERNDSNPSQNRNYNSSNNSRPYHQNNRDSDRHSNFPSRSNDIQEYQNFQPQLQASQLNYYDNEINSSSYSRYRGRGTPNRGGRGNNNRGNRGGNRGGDRGGTHNHFNNRGAQNNPGTTWGDFAKAHSAEKGNDRHSQNNDFAKRRRTNNSDNSGD